MNYILHKRFRQKAICGEVNLPATTECSSNDNLFSSKQNTISDLATIRSGAAAGATAYQKPSGGISKSDLASAVQTSLDIKQVKEAYIKQNGVIHKLQ